MKNSFGASVVFTLFGESHGEEIGAVVDGLAPGIAVEEDFIRHMLDFRRPAGAIATARQESDRFRLVSGVCHGKTTGAPLCILIPNSNARSGDYEAMRHTPRPGHADYTAQIKYHGFQDARGGGHFSGRLTAPLVAVGAVAISALRKKGIFIGTHIATLQKATDRHFSQNPIADIKALDAEPFPVLHPHAAEEMKAIIKAAADAGDSVGGTLETLVLGMPAGVGEPWFDSVEGVLSYALFGIPAVKGVEFGEGFGFSSLYGSQANDPFRMQGDRVVTMENHNGGVNGGITNGMPILFRCAVKPTPSIYQKQQTVNLSTGTDEELTITGRHDPAIVHRARVVVDSVTALVLCDLLATRYGTDALAAPGTFAESFD